MKKILITGANSYIGVSFENYLKQWSEQYSVDTVDMIDGAWREKDFSEYDTVFHVAGIAHQKETKENTALYYKVNRDLAIETAKKAKKDGVCQFVFLSSMSVYGMETGVITKKTKPQPKSNYGKSKWQAEEGISTLTDDNFKICIVRPPMVYGPGCKGNFNSVIKLSSKLPAFPKAENQRSMIYIDNLSEFVKLAIERALDGVYTPQNREYMNTTDMARWIAEEKGEKFRASGILGFGVKMMIHFIGIAKKAFGNLTYHPDLEYFDFVYCVKEIEQSVKDSIVSEGQKE